MARIRWLVIPLLAIACWFAPDAKAGRDGCEIADNCDQGAAYAACMTHAQSIVSGPYDKPDCASWQSSPYWARACRSDGLPGCSAGSDAYYYWHASSTCASRSDEYGWSPPGGVAGGNVCHQGCTYTYVLDASGGNFFSPTGSVCTTTDAPEPVIDTDGDGVPDEDDAFPNDPNESADSDGDGIGDNADYAPNDPTDGSDTPGEEDGDDEGDNTASGGGDCKAPPSCQGDGIQCNQLFQQWQIRCKGITLTGDPGNCGAGYNCAGDIAQCAMIALARKTACGVEGLDDGAVGGSPGDANGNGVADVLEGSGTGQTGDPGEDVEPTRFGLGVSPDILDQENIFGGGQCPEPPTFQIMGVSINGGNMPYWCTAMAILRACILIFGTYAALKILTGWGFA